MPFLIAAVESVLAQSYADFELLVVDDGSTDEGPEYVRSLHDLRVRLIHLEERGLAAALNKGMATARGRYLARHDADDRSAPERFARQVEYLEAHPEVAVVASCANYVDVDDRPVDDSWTRTVRTQQDPAVTPAAVRRLLPLTCCITHGSVMIRTEVLRRHGGYDAATVPAEDYDLWLRLLPDHGIAKLAERLYDYRIHGEQSGLRRREEQTARVIEAKLRFIRRQAPFLPTPAKLELPCADRGAELFERYGPSEGFIATRTGGVRGGTEETLDADVVAVTDFSALDRFAVRLIARGYEQFGNLFVRAVQSRF